MGPKKLVSDATNEVGYPGVLYQLCKEEDVLIIPQFVTHVTVKRVESSSPRTRAAGRPESVSQYQQRSKESKLNQRLESISAQDTKGEDLLNCASLRPPQVSIAYSNPDDKESPIAVICKNIYIEFALIIAIGKSLKPYPTIACLKIENCCISKEITETLALLLSEESGKWISELSLDGNEGIGAMLPLFVKLPNALRYLSLARCSLEDSDVALFAESLCFSNEKEHKLQCLNLSMNKIGDAGVSCLAKALRTNRSLISLSLVGNQIGDEGVARLTEVLQKFPLTRAEIITRRRRIFDSILRKKRLIEKRIEERRAKAEDGSQTQKTPTKGIGRKIRGPDGKIRCLSSKDSRNKSASMRMGSGEKFRGKSRQEETSSAAEPTPSEVLEIMQQVENELPPDKHPFVNEVHMMVDGAWCYGCSSLGNINLAFNYLTKKSVQGFLDVLNFQNENYPYRTGLLRLVLLPGNLFQENSPEFQKLVTAMIYHNSRRDVPENPDPSKDALSPRKPTSAMLNKK